MSTKYVKGDPNKTDITIIVDRSGSMGSIRDATIEGINGFLSSQKEVEGEAVVTLVQFDDQYQVDCRDVPIAEVCELNRATYKPRGSTALLDAIGRTVAAKRDKFATIKEEHLPGTVIFVIQTDGLENSSKEFNRSQINDLIVECREKLRWEFVFLGANQDAIASGAGMGIASSSSMSYTASSSSVARIYDATSRQVSNLRAARGKGVAYDMAFDADDRAGAKLK